MIKNLFAKLRGDMAFTFGDRGYVTGLKLEAV